MFDFKTGAPPTLKQVRTGFSPQLTLTAAILQGGGLAEAPAHTPGDLTYLHVTGRKVPAKVEVRGAAGGESLELAARALEGLTAHVARFDDPSTAYRAWSAPQFLGKRGGDYDHLSRLWEWHVMGEGDEE